MFRLFFYLMIGLGWWLPVNSLAQTQAVIDVEIKDHQFYPSVLKVPVDQKFLLKIKNQDVSAEEFESYDLNREKLVGGNKSIVVFLGPLSKGRYKYFGDFHPNTARGVMVVE